MEQDGLHLRLQREWAGQRGAGHRILERSRRSGQVRENISNNWQREKYFASFNCWGDTEDAISDLIAIKRVDSRDVVYETKKKATKVQMTCLCHSPLRKVQSAHFLGEIRGIATLAQRARQCANYARLQKLVVLALRVNRPHCG